MISAAMRAKLVVDSIATAPSIVALDRLVHELRRDGTPTPSAGGFLELLIEFRRAALARSAGAGCVVPAGE
jgi:hypothetical protein